MAVGRRRRALIRSRGYCSLRTRSCSSCWKNPPTIGDSDRITDEKDVRFLVNLECAFLASGEKNFRLLIVGQGAEEPWLRENLHQADFAGLLKGEALGTAYADMNGFAFPSRADAFANVVPGALASNVPAVVRNKGGPSSSFDMENPAY